MFHVSAFLFLFLLHTDPAPAAPPTVADIMATRAEIAKLVAKEAKQVADLNLELKKLGIAPLEAMGIGKPGKQGPPGKDGHSPVLTWGTGADFDRIAIDGVFSGPHLTGPPGSPAPLPVDPFEKKVADAYQSTPDAEKALVPALVSLFKQSLSYVDTDADTGVLFSRMVKGRRTVIMDSQLLALRQVMDKPILDLLGPNAVVLTSELRAMTKAMFQRNIDALGKVVR